MQKKKYLVLSLLMVTGCFFETEKSLTVCEGDYKVEFDRFDSLLHCEKITGNLKVHNNAYIKHLDALSNLKEISGSLDITWNRGLNNIQGLSSLGKIGGNLYIYRNDSLFGLNGLNNLKKVNRNVWIDKNKDLESLLALERLSYVGDEFIVYSGQPIPQEQIQELKERLGKE